MTNDRKIDLVVKQALAGDGYAELQVRSEKRLDKMVRRAKERYPDFLFLRLTNGVDYHRMECYIQ